MEPAEEKPRTLQEHFGREPSSSARPMNPWAVPYVFPVTEDEIDAYNHAIDENERQWEERERRQCESLLATLRMPEDIAIAGRRLTSKSESTNLLLMRMMKERDDAFVCDPEARAEEESQTARAEHKAKMKRIAAHKRIMKMNRCIVRKVAGYGCKARCEKACSPLHARDIPGTPAPPSPPLSCPGAAKKE